MTMWDKRKNAAIQAEGAFTSTVWPLMLLVTTICRWGCSWHGIWKRSCKKKMTSIGRAAHTHQTQLKYVTCNIAFARDVLGRIRHALDFFSGEHVVQQMNKLWKKQPGSSNSVWCTQLVQRIQRKGNSQLCRYYLDRFDENNKAHNFIYISDHAETSGSSSFLSPLQSSFWGTSTFHGHAKHARWTWTMNSYTSDQCLEVAYHC